MGPEPLALTHHLGYEAGLTRSRRTPIRSSATLLLGCRSSVVEELRECFPPDHRASTTGRSALRPRSEL
jgi:hypothetical protein